MMNLLKEKNADVKEIDDIFAELKSEMENEVEAQDDGIVEGYFNGALMGEKEIKAPKVEKVKTQKVKEEKTVKAPKIVNDETGLLAKYIKKDINATALWNAIKDEYYNDEEKLTILFKVYPEQFKTAAKYLKKDINTLSLKVMA